MTGVLTESAGNMSKNRLGGEQAPPGSLVETKQQNGSRVGVFEQTLLGETGGINISETVIEVPSDLAMRNIVSGRPYAIGYTPLRLTGVDPDISPDSQNWAVLDTAWLEVKTV